MRILLIDVHCKNSSTGKIVYSLYDELNKNKHIAAICYGRGPVVKEQNIFKFGLDMETVFHAGLTRLTGLTGVFSPLSTRRLIRFLEKFKPDVVHIHEMHGYFVNWAPVVSYLKTSGTKTVWTFHCEFMYTGKCGHAYDCDKWKNECGQCPQLSQYPRSLIFDFTKRMHAIKKTYMHDFNNLTIVTPSDWLRNRVSQSFLANKNIKVVRNGIDTEVFRPREVHHLRRKLNLGNEKIILSVAPDLMSNAKGGEWVVKLATQFDNQHVKFILIGITDLKREFPDNVIALGRVENQNELAEYYSLADVFVICSKRENFPTTCIEALACGTPIVGFDTGGTKETAPSWCASFVQYGNLDHLERAAKQTIFTHKPVLRDSCAQFAVEEYSQSTMLRAYLDIYCR